MTASAMQFVTPLTFQALSGNAVQTRLLDADEENAMGHINLARWADLLIIAPATANMLAKMSYGIADDLLSTLYLAAECRVFVAPAMNQAMWLKPVTQDNIRRLQQYGVTVIAPESGSQACGETGPGRMTDPVTVCEQVLPAQVGCDLTGVTVLITAGPTREYLDSVRFISNGSSGATGFAVAQAAAERGHRVTLISGASNAPQKQTSAKARYHECGRTRAANSLPCCASVHWIIPSGWP